MKAMKKCPSRFARELEKIYELGNKLNQQCENHIEGSKYESIASLLLSIDDTLRLVNRSLAILVGCAVGHLLARLL